MAHLHLVYVNRVLQDVISRLQLLIYPVSVIIDIQGGGGHMVLFNLKEANFYQLFYIVNHCILRTTSLLYTYRCLL